jgi:hypothetical protein
VRRLGLVQLAQCCRPDRRRLIEGERERFNYRISLALATPPLYTLFLCVFAYCFVVTPSIFRKSFTARFLFDYNTNTQAYLGKRERAAVDREREGEKKNEETERDENMRIMINPNLRRRILGKRSEAKHSISERF